MLILQLTEPDRAFQNFFIIKFDPNWFWGKEAKMRGEQNPIAFARLSEILE